jgi:hypothetical protein
MRILTGRGESVKGLFCWHKVSTVLDLLEGSFAPVSQLSNNSLAIDLEEFGCPAQGNPAHKKLEDL